MMGREFVSLCGLLAVLAGCAGNEARPLVNPAPAAIHASILAVRPVPATAGQDMMLRLLGGPNARPADLAEFIVRTDDGRTLSVVQPAEADLRPGSEAFLMPGSRPKLVHQL